MTFGDLQRLWTELAAIPPKAATQLAIEAQYAVYLERQEADILAFKRDESLAIPGDLDYGNVKGLSFEARQRLTQVRPATLGQAARVEGVTPAAVTALLAYVRPLQSRQSA